MVRPSLLRSTLIALAVPKRALAIAVVAIPLLLAQVRLSREPLAGLVGAAMIGAFILLGPLTWRALFRDPDASPNTFDAPFGRLVVFATMGAGTVALTGVVFPRLFGLGPTLMTTNASLIVSMALFWVGGYGLGRDIDLEAGLARARARADDLGRQAEHARLLALRSHLDPHFLFNTLNAIAEWCREDPEMAERSIMRLSQMLRTILGASRRTSWSLPEELAVCRELFELHLVRDPDLFELEIASGMDFADVRVPPLVLLPLCENAVKHGPRGSRRGRIVVSAEKKGEGVEVTVENPGGYAGPRAGGEGIALVEQRLALAHGARATLRLRDLGDRTRATVELPRGREPEVET